MKKFEHGDTVRIKQSTVPSYFGGLETKIVSASEYTVKGEHLYAVVVQHPVHQVDPVELAYFGSELTLVRKAEDGQEN